MSDSAIDGFDPYRKWLGIPPKDQPPHHYRLLGIAAFEDDPDVIENAADRQMAHVRTFQSGRHSKTSQKILNELAAAKVCLLDPQKKSSYDRQLRQKEEEKSQQGPPDAGPPVAPPKPAMPPKPGLTGIPPAPPADRQAPAPPRGAIPGIAFPGEPEQQRETTNPDNREGVDFQFKPSGGKRSVPIPRTGSASPGVAVSGAAVASDGFNGPAPIASAGATRVRTGARRKKSSPLPFILGGAGVLIVLIGVVFAASSPGGGNDRNAGNETSKPTGSSLASDARTGQTAGSGTSRTASNNGHTSQRSGGRPGNSSTRWPGIGAGTPDNGPEAVVPTSFPSPGNDPAAHDQPRGSGDNGSAKPPSASIEQTLRQVRASLGRRDVTEAERLIEQADRAARSRSDAAAVQHARLLVAYSKQFFELVRGGIRSVRTPSHWATTEPAEDEERIPPSIEFRGDTAAEFSLNGNIINYKVGSQDRQAMFHELSGEEMEAFARRKIRDGDAFSKLYVATFWLFDERTDNAAGRRKAIAIWEEVAEEGHRDDVLARELGIDPGRDVGPAETENSPFGEISSDFEPGADNRPGHTGLPIPGVHDGDGSGKELGAPAGGTDAGTGSDFQMARPAPAPERRPVPQNDELMEARAAISKLFKNEFINARTDEAKRELAIRVVDDAMKEKDLALKFAYLERARDLSVELANPEALDLIIDEMADDFEIDAISEKSIYLNKCIAEAKAVAQFHEIFLAARDLYKKELEAKDYEQAASLARTARRAAGKANQPGSLRTVEKELYKIEQLASEMKRAKKAALVLKENAADPEANSAVGEFLCFYQEEWNRGLPYLSRGADEEIADLAKRQLQKKMSFDEKFELADDWLAMGRRKGGMPGAAMIGIAVSTYTRLVREASGLERAKVQGKLAEAKELQDDDE